MNTTKKWTAVLLALVMALTLAACGGGKSGGKSVGSSKPDSNLGKYIGEEVLSSDNEWVPFDDIYDLGSSYIELKEGGKGDFCMEDDIKEIEWTLDNDGKLVLSSYGTTCNGTLKDGLISLDDYFGFDLQMTFRKGGSLVSSSKAEGSLDDFADEYGGDWHGMAGLTDATGDLANLNDTAHEILARLVFDGNGGCEVWLAMYLEGENDFNFIDTRAYVVPDDDTGLELRGEFMGGEMQEGILSVDATGALYVSCEVDSDLVDGSISLLANLRHLDDESWTDDDFIPLPEDAVAYYRGMSFMDIASTYMILAEEFGAEVVGVDTLDQTIMQVLTGRADATLNSEVSIADYMQKRPDANIKIVALTEEANLVAIPTRKTDDSASLLEAINQAIAELREEGKLSEISMKYFGRDITAETVGEAAE